MRDVLIIQVPAKSVLRSVGCLSNIDYANVNNMDFLADPYNNDQVHNKALHFIYNSLKKYNIKLDQRVITYFSEIINNAYDAFSKVSHFSPEKELILKIVVKDDKKNVLIKIMDNGSGFTNKPKGMYFTVPEINEEPKDKSKFIGGSNIGLINLDSSLQDMNGHLFFKNRKESGVSVYMQLDKSLSVTPSREKGHKKCKAYIFKIFSHLFNHKERQTPKQDKNIYSLPIH